MALIRRHGTKNEIHDVMPRDLFIIARADEELYRYLVMHYSERPDTAIILDRRMGERRRSAAVPPVAERRRMDRRSRPEVEADLQSLGFAVVRVS